MTKSELFWNWWFIAAYLSPFIVFAVFQKFRFSLFAAIPFSILLFVSFYYFGVEMIVDRISDTASNTQELRNISVDTGLVMSPFFQGIPFGIFWTTIAFIGTLLVQINAGSRERRMSELQSLTRCPTCDRIVSVFTRTCPRCMTCMSQSLLSIPRSSIVQNDRNPYSFSVSHSPEEEEP